MARQFKSITVGELARALTEAAEEHGADTVVTFASDYGDYSHTRQVHQLDGEVMLLAVEPNAYSESGFAVARSIAEAGDNPQFVLVIE